MLRSAECRLIVSKMSRPCFLTVEITERIFAKLSAPLLVRKPPDIFGSYLNYNNLLCGVSLIHCRENACLWGSFTLN